MRRRLTDRNKGFTPILVFGVTTLFILPTSILAADAPATQPTASPVSVASTESQTKKQQDIRRLLEVTNSAALSRQVMMQVIQQQRIANPHVPQSFWDDFENEINTEELIELVIPVYEKHLSHDDIAAAIRFYESPEGQRMIAAMPQIIHESVQIGQIWGQKLGQRVHQKMKDAGM